MKRIIRYPGTRLDRLGKFLDNTVSSVMAFGAIVVTALITLIVTLAVVFDIISVALVIITAAIEVFDIGYFVVYAIVTFALVIRDRKGE